MSKRKSRAAKPQTAPETDLAIMVPKELPVLPDGEKVASLRDFGYKVATYADRGTAYGEWAHDNIPGFPDNVPEEKKAEVFAGFIARKADLMEPSVKSYRKEGADNFILMVPGETSVSTVRLTAAYAMSYSSQQFGSIRKTQPNLHRLVKEIRDEVNKYCSNRWTALVNLYKAAHKESRKRDINKTFAEWLDETIANIIKRHKTALARTMGSDGKPDPSLPGKEAVAAACAVLRKALVL